MKLTIALSIIFLLPVSAAQAETRVTDSQQVCQKRIDGYKSGLQAEIDKKKNIDAAKAELDLINKLPSTLSSCDKQKQIPALSDKDEASRQANEAQQDRKISP